MRSLKQHNLPFRSVEIKLRNYFKLNIFNLIFYLDGDSDDNRGLTYIMDLEFNWSVFPQKLSSKRYDHIAKVKGN